ncbi:hypothetical protein MTBLM1_90112 [Rhodospirillaceae bacterium LM-1]|nr:hypothetical protein MTBLM1_90112 [Rhodospirillaceae bacterium LM-1]
MTKQQQADIDWEQVHGRLKASNQAMARALEPDPLQITAIQKWRAAYLATRAHDPDESTDVRVLVFSVAQERFAIPLEEISEVSGATLCTPVPGLGRALLGLANLHGEIRPVLDTAVLLDIPRQGAANPKPPSVFYLRWGQRRLGLAADFLEGVLTLDAKQLHKASAEGAGMPRRFIKAITAGTLALIDVPALLEGCGLGNNTMNDSLQEGKRA